MGLSLGFVFYNVDLDTGGMWRQARQLACRLAARGHRVTVVSTIAPWRLLAPRIELPGVTVHRVPVTRTPFFETIARALFNKAGGVQVLYAVHYRCGVHAARIAAASGTPIAVKFACSGPHGDFEAIKRQKTHETSRALLGKAARYVCISRAIEEEARAYGLDASKLVSIPNGVDLGVFAGGGPRASLAGRVVLYLGRLERQKRVDVLIRAFAKVPVQDARLAIAGTGSLEGELRALASELGVAARVDFLGSRSDVAALHRAAEVFALSSDEEGQPNALLEALAAGTPTVATRVPGTDEVVGHERDALLVPRDDPAALGAAITRLLEDRALAARLATAGKDRARDFDFEQVARRHEALFAELAERRGVEG